MTTLSRDFSRRHRVHLLFRETPIVRLEIFIPDNIAKKSVDSLPFLARVRAMFCPNHKIDDRTDPKFAAHKADPSRAQEDLSSGFGMEDRGVPREWNDEYQCLLELPNDTPELVSRRFGCGTVGQEEGRGIY